MLNRLISEIQRQVRAMENHQQRFMPTMIPPTIPPALKTTETPVSTTWLDEDYSNFEELRRGSNMFKKLLNDYPYNDVLD